MVSVTDPALDRSHSLVWELILETVVDALYGAIEEAEVRAGEH